MICFKAFKILQLNNAVDVSCETFSTLEMMKSRERISLRVNTQGHLSKPTEYGQMTACLHLTFNIFMRYHKSVLFMLLKVE